MVFLKQSLVICITLPLIACNASAIKETPKPAVLERSSVEVRSVLNATISAALNGTKVTVGSKALVNSDRLTIQRNLSEPAGMKGLNGHLVGRPVIHQFSMVKAGSSCYLIHEKTKKRYLLQGVSCKEVKP